MTESPYAVTAAARSTSPQAQVTQNSTADRRMVVPCTQNPAHAAINSLPPEILSYIFLCVYRCSNDWSQPYAWLVVNLVCRYWYDVATQHPRLWADVHIDLERNTRHGFIEMLLERSKSALLNVIFKDYSPFYRRKNSSLDGIALLRSVLKQMDRIQLLQLGCSVTSANEFHRLLRKSAPRLRDYQITAYMPGQDGCLLLPDEAPSLNRLCYSCGTSPPWRTLASMTDLHVLRLSDMPKDPMTLPLLLDTLACLRRLVFLELNIYLDPVDISSGASFVTVTLPKLAVLKCLGGAYTLATLMNHLRIPSSAYLNFLLNTHRALDSALEARLLTDGLVSILTGPRIDDSIPGPFVTLMICYYDPDNFILLGRHTTDIGTESFHEYGSDESALAQQKGFRCMFPCTTQSSSAVDVVAALPLKSVTLLVLESFVVDNVPPCHIQSRDFETLATALPNVTQLRCYAWLAGEFVEWMRGRKRCGPESPAWPQLTTLTFAGDDLQPIGSNEKVAVDVLWESLKQRHPGDFPALSRFSIESSKERVYYEI